MYPSATAYAAYDSALLRAQHQAARCDSCAWGNACAARVVGWPVAPSEVLRTVPTVVASAEYVFGSTDVHIPRAVWPVAFAGADVPEQPTVKAATATAVAVSELPVLRMACPRSANYIVIRLRESRKSSPLLAAATKVTPGPRRGATRGDADIAGVTRRPRLFLVADAAARHFLGRPAVPVRRSGLRQSRCLRGSV